MGVRRWEAAKRSFGRVGGDAKEGQVVLRCVPELRLSCALLDDGGGVDVNTRSIVCLLVGFCWVGALLRSACFNVAGLFWQHCLQQ